jgi:HEAT repeat protein
VTAAFLFLAICLVPDDPAPHVAALRKKGATPAEKIEACRQLAAMGPDAKDSARALCEAMVDRDYEVRDVATEALGKVYPELARMLAFGDRGRSRERWVTGLCAMGPDGAAAVPVLLAMMRDGRKKSDLPYVAQALTVVGAKDKDVTAEAIKLLRTSESAGVRAVVAKALPLMENGKSGIPLLISVATDPYSPQSVVVAAVHALGKFGRDAQQALPALQRLSRSRDSEVRDAAANAYERIKKG